MKMESGMTGVLIKKRNWDPDVNRERDHHVEGKDGARHPQATHGRGGRRPPEARGGAWSRRPRASEGNQPC